MTRIPAATADRLTAAYRPARDVSALATAMLTDEAFARDPGAAGQAAGGVAGRRAAPARHRPVGAGRGPRKQLLLGGLNGLGQVPLQPPSVGGWPADAAWLTTSSLQVRLRLGAALAAAAGPAALDVVSTGTPSSKVDALARLLVVDAWTDRTRAALTAAAGNPRQLLTVGLVSPEYTVS